MKKFVAILLLSLICLTTVSGKFAVWDNGYELAADGEDSETESKESKKEIKEFTLSACKRSFTIPSLAYSYKIHQAFLFPKPVIDTQTPPPNWPFAF